MGGRRMARNCGFMEYHYQAVAAETGYADLRRSIEAAQMFSRHARLDRVVTIPVVVHILEHSGLARVTDEQVHSQMTVLNDDFRGRNADIGNVPPVFRPLIGDSMIEFALARRDPLGRATDGIVRVETSIPMFPQAQVPPDQYPTTIIDEEVKRAGTGSPAWPRNEYLNLWVCNMGRDPLGYAAFPGSAAWRDGVVVDFTCFGTGGSAKPDFDLGRTTVHEVGHWLDLLHIWGDDQRRSDVCSLSDNVADTPNQGGPNFDAPAFPRISCGNAPDGDLFVNFMDYVDDVAMCMFTQGQVDRMQAALQGPRRSLLVSRGLDQPDQPSEAARSLESLSLAVRAVLAEAGQTPELVFDGVDWVQRPR